MCVCVCVCVCACTRAYYNKCAPNISAFFFCWKNTL